MSIRTVPWWSRLGLALLCLTWSGPIGSAQGVSVPSTVETSGLELITPATQQAINRGLESLAASQQEDGSFGSGSTHRRHVAVTALAGMAFLSAGNVPERGKYGRTVQRAVDYILANTDPTGLISAPEHRQQNPMYGHGFATLFLAEVYGMTRQSEVRDKLKLAINLIVSSQNREGGWRYFPVRREADVSATVCQIMALRAARNAGMYVPKSTVDACTRYVKQCQNPDGGFSYQLLAGTQSIWPRSAAGLVALYSAGIYEGREIEKGLRYLMGHIPRGEVFRHEAFYYYGHYYAVQAMWHAGGNYWRQWYPAIRDELLNRQTQNGSWSDMTVNSEYATAMACIVLQMPNNYLPIFQR
ncbi:MAG: prenyltransferase/squalene oxidase repeat-containing protein [Planctomycetales bacterium]